MRTCCVDIKVSGFVGHVSCQLKTRSAGLDSTRVAHCLGDIHSEGTPLDVLPGKQHLHLGTSWVPLPRWNDTVLLEKG